MLAKQTGQTSTIHESETVSASIIPVFVGNFDGMLAKHLSPTILLAPLQI
jgi:hypothetical protein